jgi:signal transduction histidine kinase
MTPQMPTLADADLTDADPRLLEALANLNQIGAVINRIGPTDRASMDDTLRLIAGSAIKVVPGSSAVIYSCGQTGWTFDLDSRVSAGEPDDYVPNDEPRPNGIGARAIALRRRVLSYEEEDLEIHPDKVRVGARAMACFPLIVAYQPVGILYLYLHQERQFSQLELLMLENFVNQAAMAIHQTRQLARVQRDLARKEDELNRLRRAGLLISSRLRLKETLEAILQMAMDVTGARYGTFRLLDKSSQKLVTRAIAGERLGQPRVEALPIDDSSIMGWVAVHRQPVYVHDLQAEPWGHIYYPLDADVEMRSELAVPLIGASGRLEGVLNLESPLVGAFGEQDSHLLQSLATQAVIAIQEVRLLDALQEVAQRLLTQPCHQVLSRLVELACDLLNAAVTAIWILQGEELVLEVANDDHWRGECIPLHDSLTGRAITSRGPVTSDDVRTDPRFNRTELARAQGWARALVVPLLTSDDREPIGAFGVYSVGSEPGRFAESEWDTKVLTCLAHYATLAVHNQARQEALRAAQERHAVAETFAAVGDIAANVLHHLNNKVGTIPVRVQGIQDKCQSALLADDYLATKLVEIEHSASEAMAAVRENLSHLHPIHLAAVDVAACVTAAVEAIDLPPGVRVEIEKLDLPRVMAAKHSLTLVFANLVGNAGDAMPGGGVITIRGALDDDEVKVTISDDGPGIAPELHDRIFEFNFSGGAAAHPGKLGFGLWWVKVLMVRLGGSVGVESDGNNGTTFWLKIPCAEQEA